MVSPVSFVSLNLQRALQLLGLNHIYQELKGLALAYENLSGIEIGNWVDSMIGGEIVIIDQGRAPEVSEAHPAKGKAFQTTELVGRAFERNVSEIWSWLMKDDVLSIGIYGIGGVGKTSLLRHINDQLLQRPSSFQNVFWITVTQDFSIYKLQNLIAKLLI